MSTLSTANIQAKAAATPPVIKDLNGTEVGQFCRAWVNCDNAGTTADSFNVSSVTDNGVGDLTVNFTSPMPNVNYCMTGGAIYSNGPGTGFGVISIKEGDATGNPDTKTISTCRVKNGHVQSASNSLNCCQITNAQVQIYMIFFGG